MEYVEKNIINIEIAKKIFERKIIMFDEWGLDKLYPYVYDENAIKDGASTTTNLAGANWIKGKDADGNIVEIYGRPIPNYYEDLNKVHYVERKIKEIGKENDYIRELRKECLSEFELAHATAKQKCKAILNCMENSR